MSEEISIEELVAQLIAAIEMTSEATTNLRDTTNIMARLLATLQEAETLQAQNLRDLQELRRALPDLTLDLRATSTHLRQSLRPPILKTWLTAASLILATTLAVVFGLTAINPTWTLSSTEHDQLRMGQLVGEKAIQLPDERQQLLQQLLLEMASIP